MLCKSFKIKDIFIFDTAKLDCLDMAFIVYDKEISLSEELINPLETSHLARVSLFKDVVLFIIFIALVEDRKFLSVMVIDKGKIVGMSDCLSRSEYQPSTCQRIYMTSQGKIGVVIDDDILIMESVRSHYINDADYVVYMTLDQFNNNTARILYAHSVFTEIPILAVFSDCLWCYSKKIERKQNEELVSLNYYKKSCPKELLEKFSKPSFEFY